MPLAMRRVIPAASVQCLGWGSPFVVRSRRWHLFVNYACNVRSCLQPGEVAQRRPGSDSRMPPSEREREREVCSHLTLTLTLTLNRCVHSGLDGRGRPATALSVH